MRRTDTPSKIRNWFTISVIRNGRRGKVTLEMASATKITSVETFLSRVWELKDSAYLHLYRGQHEDFPLLPKLFRPPRNAKTVRKTEDELLHQFKNRSPYLLPTKPDNDWDWLSLGQHFGLPTRLLDWTGNPLSALFFALDADSHLSPTVYIYHAKEHQIIDEDVKQTEHPFKIKQTRIFQPMGHSPRVAMQAGWHTVHRIHGKDDKRRFLPLEDMEYHQQKLDKVQIEPPALEPLRNELREMGIHHATIYGDLHTVCVSIAREFGIN
jgi:hypothetical protein